MNGQSHMTRILLISRDIVDYYFLLQFVQLAPYQFVFLSLLNFGECISFYCSVTYYHELSGLNNTPLKLSVLHDRCWDMASLASALQVSKAEIKVSVKLSFCLETQEELAFKLIKIVGRIQCGISTWLSTSDYFSFQGMPTSPKLAMQSQKFNEISHA